MIAIVKFCIPDRGTHANILEILQQEIAQIERIDDIVDEIAVGLAPNHLLFSNPKIHEAGIDIDIGFAQYNFDILLIFNAIHNIH